jgi:hypothetical protein
MMFRRLAASITACVMALSVAAQVQMAQREVSKEVRSKLFKQVLADYPDVRECVNEGGGASAAEENMSATEIDLNRDGIPEYCPIHTSSALALARS